MKKRVEEAINLTRYGFSVFPCVPNKKIPRKGIQFNEMATVDKDRIRQWWDEEPEANVGIVCNSFRDGKYLAVIDIDKKNGGWDTFNELSLLNDFPATAYQDTPGGGRHLIYFSEKPVPQGVHTLGPGIDTRAPGGYILGQGSSIDGRTYKFNPAPIVELPDWIMNELLEKRSQDKAAGADSERQEVVSSIGYARAKSYLENEAPVAIEGQGGDMTTFKVAARVRDMGVPESVCLELMLGHWNDRCVPSWDESELSRKVANAYRYGLNGQGSDSPEAVFSAVEEQPLVGGEPAQAKKPTLSYISFKDIEPNLKQGTLVKGVLDPESMSVIYGESNTGKTFFALDMALHVAWGKTWRGRRVEQGGVLYIAAEGGDGAKRRVKAFRQHHALDGRDISFALVPCSVDLLDPKADAKEIVALANQFEEEFGKKPAMVVIDTLSRAIAGGNENSPEDMTAFIRNVDRIREATKSHMLIIHHSGKDKARGARGHSSLRAATDTEIEIEKGKARVTKQRDMELAPDMGFALHPIIIGKNAEGEEVSSCIVMEADLDGNTSSLDPNTQTGKAFVALTATSDFGEAVSTDDWRDKFLEMHYQDNRKSGYKPFQRAMKALEKGGHITVKDGKAWVTPEEDE